jgi:hypothetical protein
VISTLRAGAEVVDAPNGNGKNGNGYSAINNAITTILVALFVLLIPIIYSLNQSVARLQSEHDSFVAEQAVEHETIELVRRELSDAKREDRGAGDYRSDWRA